MRKSIAYKALDVEKRLHSLADRDKAKILSRFFKTGPGEYGEGDVFLGINVPQQRILSQDFKDLSLSEIKKLLQNPVHECRFTGLQILVARYKDGDPLDQKKIVDFYLKNTKYINNWDLVDTSIPYIIGDYVLTKDKEILYRLVKSKSLWERRMAVLGTALLIKKKEFSDIFAIVDILMNDRHDLIHKACGWMLREVGKKDVSALVEFLSSRYNKMPRTMLRYAIEKFNRIQRNAYLQGRI